MAKYEVGMRDVISLVSSHRANMKVKNLTRRLPVVPECTQY